MPTGAERRQILRMALASALAWGLGSLLGAAHPTFAALAVIFSLQGNASVSLRTAAQRLVGVGGGVVIGLVALHGPGLSPPVVGALILLALLAGSGLRLSGQLNTQVAVSALLLLAGGGGWRYGAQRLWETALGGVVAVLVSALLWPVDPAALLAAEAAQVQEGLQADLRGAAGAFDAPRGAARRYLGRVEGRARRAERLALQAPEALGQVRWAPWADAAGLDRLHAAAQCLAALYRHVWVLARQAADGGGALPGPGPAAALEALAEASRILGPRPAPEVLGRVRAASRLAPTETDAGWRQAAAAATIRQLAADLRGWWHAQRRAPQGS